MAILEVLRDLPGINTTSGGTQNNASTIRAACYCSMMYTHLEPLDGVSLGDLVLVTDLGALRLALRHAVSWAVKYDVKVHSVDTWTGKREAR